MHSAEFRRCLVECDVAGIRRIWAHVAPHDHQASDAGVLSWLHLVRTQAESIPLKLRAYSHRWLVDNGYPSGLPDQLKPSAERLYPQVVDGVGIAVLASSELMRPMAVKVRDAMSNAVAEAYADGRKEPEFVRARMHEARVKCLSSL